MGKPRRKGWRRWFLGSVVDTIISQAHDINFYLLGDAGLSGANPRPKPLISTMISANRRSFTAALWAVLVPAALTLAGWPFRSFLKHSNILLVYLLGVFFVAIQYGLWPPSWHRSSAPALLRFSSRPHFFLRHLRPGKSGRLVGDAGGGCGDQQIGRKRARPGQGRGTAEQRAAALYRLSKELAEARLESEIIAIVCATSMPNLVGAIRFYFPTAAEN